MRTIVPRAAYLPLCILALAAACAPAAAPPVVAVPTATPAPPPAIPRRTGGKPVLVPQSVSSPSQPAWSPDGRTVAVHANEGLMLCDPEQGAVRGVLPAGGTPLWTADGAALVVENRTSITSWNVAAGKCRAEIDLRGAARVSTQATAVAVARGEGIEVLDPLTGARRASFQAASPSAIDVGTSGRRLAAGFKDGSVRVWEIAGGEAHVFAQSGPPVVAAALSSDEKVLATLHTGDKPTVVVWDLEAERKLRAVELPPGSPTGLTWVPGRRSLVVLAGSDASSFLVRPDAPPIALDEVQAVRNPPSGNEIGLIKVVTQHTLSTLLPPSAPLGTLTLRNLETGGEQAVDLDACILCGALDVGFRAGDDAVAYAYAGIYDSAGRLGIQGPGGGWLTFDSRPSACSELAWENGGTTLMVHLGTYKLRWTLASGTVDAEYVEPERPPQVWGEPVPEVPTPEPDPLAPRDLGNFGDRNVGWLPGKRAGQGTVVIEDARGKKTLRGLDDALGPTPDGEQVVTVRGGAIVLFSAATGKPGATLRVSRRSELDASDVTWSPDGATVAVREYVDKPKGRRDRAGFKLWDRRTGKQLFASKDGGAPVFGALGAAPALAFATADRVVMIDAHTGAERAALPGSRCAGPTVGGDRVLALCGDGKGQRAVLWDAGKRAEIPLASPPAEPSRHALGGDGAFAAALGKDGLVLWDARTGAVVGRFAPDAASDFAFSPDGRFVVLGGTSGATAVRLADRRRLHLVEQGGATLAHTDDLLFDGDGAVAEELRVRLGDDLLQSDVVRLAQLADRYQRPKLVEDFFADKPVALPGDLADGLGPPPGLTLAASPVEGDHTTVTLRAVDRGGGIGALRLFSGGKPVEVPAPTSAETGAGVVERSLEVPVGPKTTLTAHATAARGGTRSPSEQVTPKQRAEGSGPSR